MFQLYINQLVVWFCAGRCGRLSACHSSQSHPGTLAHPFTPKVPRSKERIPNFLLFRCFHFKLTFESIKELGKVSLDVKFDEGIFGYKSLHPWDNVQFNME
jgi:hypothetical protein